MIINIPKVGAVQFRDNLSPEEFKTQLAGIHKKFGLPPPAKPDIGIGTLAKRGFMRSMGQVGTAMGDVLPAMGASALGFDDYARKQMDEAATSQAELEQKYPTQFKSYNEVQGLGDAAGFGAETLGELGATMVPVIGWGGAGAKVASSVGGKLAAAELAKRGITGTAAQVGVQQAAQTAGKRGLYGGAYFGSASQNIPEVFEGIYKETDKLEPGIAALWGGIGSVLDTVIPGQVMSQLGGYGRQKLIAEVAKQTGAAPAIWKKIASELPKLAVAEGLTEGAQEMISAHARQVAGSAKDIFDPENIQQYKEAFVKGAVGGSAFGGISGVSKGIQEKQAYGVARDKEMAAVAGLRDKLDQTPVYAPEYAGLQQGYDNLRNRISTRYGAQYAPEPYTKEMGPTGMAGTTQQPTEEAPVVSPEAGIQAVTPTNTATGQTPEIVTTDQIPEPTIRARAQPPVTPLGANNKFLNRTLGLKLNHPMATFMKGMDLGDVANLSQVLQFVEDSKISGKFDMPMERAVNRLAEKVPPEIMAQARQQVVAKAPEPTTEPPILPQEEIAPATIEAAQQEPVPDNRIAEVLAQGQEQEITTPVETQLKKQAPPVSQEPAPVSNAASGFTTKAGTVFTLDEQGNAARGTEPPHPTLYLDKKNKAALTDEMVGNPNASVRLGYDNQGNFSPVNNTADIPEGAEPMVGLVDKETGDNIQSFPAENTPAKGLHPVQRLLRPGLAHSVYVSPQPIKSTNTTATQPAPTEQVSKPAPIEEVQPKEFAGRTDAEQVAELVAKKNFGPKELPERNARSYFEKGDLDAALKNIAYDSIAKPNDNVVRNARKWVEGKLSPKAKAKLESHLNDLVESRAPLPFEKQQAKQEKEAERVKKTEAKQVKQYVEKEKTVKPKKSTAQIIEESDKTSTPEVEVSAATRAIMKMRGIEPGATVTPKQEYDDILYDLNQEYGTYKDELDADATQIGTKLHSEVNASLKEGDLAKALQQVAARSKSTVRTIAEALQKHVGDVKVEFGAKSKFNPNTNTITLKEGATMYDLLHESTHAAVSHVLDKPSHPVTKQLQNILNEVAAKIDPAYGTQNVQEFAAEAWSSGEFRKVLRDTRSSIENKSLWQKIVDAVRRLLGMPVKKSDTTIDAIDKLIDSIVSEPPKSRVGDSLYAESIRSPNVVQSIFRGLDKATQYGGESTDARLIRVRSDFEKVTTAGKGVMLKTLNLSALGRISGSVFDRLGISFSNTANLMSGYQEQLQEAGYHQHRALQKYAQNPRYEQLTKAMLESTVANVNPEASAKEIKEYTNDQDDTKRLAEYQRIRGIFFNKLNAHERTLWRDTFASFRKLRVEAFASLEKNLHSSIDDKKIAASTYQKLVAELNKTWIDNYLPLMRRGEYRLEYQQDGERKVSFYRTDVERVAGQKELETKGATEFNAYTESSIDIKHSIPDSQLMGQVIKLLEQGGANKDAVEQVAQLIAKAMPETSMLKRGIHRKNVGGYMTDISLVYDNVTSSTIHELSRLTFARDLQQHTVAMVEKSKDLKGSDQEFARLLIKEFEDRRKFITNPNISSFAQLASSGSFFYFLAANVSSAVVNLLQVPLIVMPQLAGRYGWVNAFKMLMNAADLYKGSGFKRKTKTLAGGEVEFNAMLSLENLVNAGKADKYKGLVERLKAYGFLQTSTARDAVISANQDSSAYGGATRAHYLANLTGTFMFHHAERFNREITAVAAFDLEMQKLAKDNSLTPAEREEKAIQKAVYDVEFMHGAGHTLTGPSLGHSNLGKVLMVFKRFAFSMYYVLFDTMFRALPIKKGYTPEQIAETKVARKQLAGMYGIGFMFAGVKGLPMYWVAETAYNMVKGEDDDEFDVVVRDALGDMPFKGPVNYFTNLAVADRVGWDDLIFREAKKDRSGDAALSQYLEAALGAPYSIANNMIKAKNHIDNGHFQRAVETALPTSMSNVLKGTRFGTEGVNTLRGDPVMGEVGAYNSIAQVFGFSPADLSLKYKTNEARKQVEYKFTNMKSNLMSQYYAAYRLGDSDKEAELHEKLMDLADRHPELGITQDFIDRSIRARDSQSEAMVDGISIPKRFKTDSSSIAFKDIQ